MKNAWDKAWSGLDTYGDIRVRKGRAREKLEIFEKMGLSYLGINKVTDFGAGGGYVSDEFLKKANNPNLIIKLLEFTDSGVKMARERFTNNPNIEVIQADISKPLDLKQDSDLAMAFSVLEHIEDTQTGIQNIHSSLKAKGQLLLIWSNKNSILRQQREKEVKNNTWVYGYQKEIDEEELLDLIGGKFDIKKTMVVPCLGYKGKRFLTLRDNLAHLIVPNNGRYLFSILEKG